MPVSRHPPTLLIPSLPKQVLVGIDLLSLTTSSRFKGFTTIPPGWHFLFVGATAELSARQGLWFFVPGPDEGSGARIGGKRQRADSQLLGVRGEIVPTPMLSETTGDWLAVLEWDVEAEELKLADDQARLEEWRQRLLSNPDLQKSLFPYRKSVPPSDTTGVQELEGHEKPGLEQSVNFPSLIEHLSEHLLKRTCGLPHAGFFTLNTVSTSRSDAEAERIPGLNNDDQLQGKLLGLLDINLKKTWPDGAVGRERTEAARDRTWRLIDIVKRTHEGQTRSTGEVEFNEAIPTPEQDTQIVTDTTWGHELLGELEFCFLMTLTLANWSCLAQWRRLIELILTCQTGILQHSSFFAQFLSTLTMQLSHTSLVEGFGLFDVGEDGSDFLKHLLRRFRATLEELEDNYPHQGAMNPVKLQMKEVELVVRDIWGWELDNSWTRRGMVQLEDGELIEMETQDMEGEDERGEYAPTVVET